MPPKYKIPTDKEPANVPGTHPIEPDMLPVKPETLPIEALVKEKIPETVRIDY